MVQVERAILLNNKKNYGLVNAILKKKTMPVLIPWFPAYGVYIANHQMPEISTS